MSEPEPRDLGESPPFVSVAHRRSNRTAFAWGFVVGACAGWLVVLLATAMGRLP